MNQPEGNARDRRIRRIIDDLRDRLRRSPRLRRRTLGMLRGELPAPDLTNDEKDDDGEPEG